jgi:hypothetical protein
MTECVACREEGRIAAATYIPEKRSMALKHADRAEHESGV